MGLFSGFVAYLPFALLAADSDVPMQASELKLLKSCEYFQYVLFIQPGQTLSGEEGWDLYSGRDTPNFSCSWCQKDAARCQLLGYQVTGVQ